MAIEMNLVKPKTLGLALWNIGASTTGLGSMHLVNSSSLLSSVLKILSARDRVNVVQFSSSNSDINCRRSLSLSNHFLSDRDLQESCHNH